MAQFSPSRFFSKNSIEHGNHAQPRKKRLAGGGAEANGTFRVQYQRGGSSTEEKPRNLEDLLESWAEYVQGNVQGNTAQGWTTNYWERTANYPVS